MIQYLAASSGHGKAALKTYLKITCRTMIEAMNKRMTRAIAVDMIEMTFPTLSNALNISPLLRSSHATHVKPYGVACESNLYP